MAACPAIVVFDIDGVIRDVGGSYRRALADTVEQFTQGGYRPSAAEIDALKTEGLWNNDWEAARELVYRYFETQGKARTQQAMGEARSETIDYAELVAFFQSRYRGTDPHHWTGYICDEPLLLQPAYLEHLTQAGIVWGFFSGATRGSACYVLEKRLGLRSPPLVAMEDAPGKPNPAGLLAIVQQLTGDTATPVIYVGDTVADMQTVENAQRDNPHRTWIAVGVVPPHAQASSEYCLSYTAVLQQAGAAIVFENVEQLTPAQVKGLVSMS